MNTNDAVAKRILELMKEKNYTQYRVEQKSCVYHGAMNRILTGKNKGITLETVFKLAKAFDMSISEFCSGELFDEDNIEIE